MFESFLCVCVCVCACACGVVIRTRRTYTQRHTENMDMCVCLCLRVCARVRVRVAWWHGGSVACTACTAASQQEGHGFDSRMGRCWLWGGRSSPECTVLKWAISRAFLCGVCMFSPCSQGVSSSKNLNRKNMQNNRTHVHP